MRAKFKIKNPKYRITIYLGFANVELQGVEPWSKHIRR